MPEGQGQRIWRASDDIRYKVLEKLNSANASVVESHAFEIDVESHAFEIDDFPSRIFKIFSRHVLQMEGMWT